MIPPSFPPPFGVNTRLGAYNRARLGISREEDSSSYLLHYVEELCRWVHSIFIEGVKLVWTLLGLLLIGFVVLQQILR